MWGTVIKIIFSILVISVMVAFLTSFGGLAAINEQVSHFKGAFDFIIANLKTLSHVFPWVIDAVGIFTAIIAIEFIIVGWKIFNFLLSKTNK